MNRRPPPAGTGPAPAARVAVLPFLRGCGQMLFQPSALTGSVFLLLILFQSVDSFVACTAGAVGSTLCAFLLEHPKQPYFQGEGGFNGALLGLALSVFYEPGMALLLVAVAGGFATGLVRVALLRLLPVPPFTAPFILVGWTLFLLDGALGLAVSGGIPVESRPILTGATNASQVLFINDPRAGVLVFAAVLLHSRVAALWVAVASLLAWWVSFLFFLPVDMAAPGLLGYNALILAAALQQRDTPGLLVLGGVVGSVLVSYVFFSHALTPLSAPFVVCAWAVIALEWLRGRPQINSP